MAGKPGRSGTKTGVMSNEAVANFKAEMHDGEPLSRKAKRYPVTAQTLSDIRSGKIWASIPAADKADKETIWTPKRRL